MGIFDFLIKKDYSVDEQLKKQLEKRNIKEVTPEAVVAKRKESVVTKSPFDYLVKPIETTTKTTTPSVDLTVLNKPKEIKKEEKKDVSLPVMLPISYGVMLPVDREKVVKLGERTVIESIDLANKTGQFISGMWGDIIKGISNVIESRKQGLNKMERGELNIIDNEIVNTTPKGYLRDINDAELDYLQVKQKITEDTDRTFSYLLEGVNKNVPGVATVFNDIEKDIKYLKTKEFYQNSKEWEDASWEEKFTKRLPETLYNYAPQLLSTYGFYAIAPLAGSVVTAGSAADDIRDEAIAAGEGGVEADAIALVSGVGQAAFEYFAQERIRSPKSAEINEFIYALGKKNIPEYISGLVKKIYPTVKSIFKTGVIGSGTETSQEVLQIAGESYFREIGKDETEARLATSYLLGFIGDVGFDIGGRMVNNFKNGDYKNIKPGLTIEDVSQMNRKLNEENSERTKQKIMMGKMEDNRATNDVVLNKIKNTGVIPTDATPDYNVTVYRAAKPDVENTGESQIFPGDFVTTNKKTAERYIKERPGSTLEQLDVQVKDLIDYGGTRYEYVFAPQEFVDTETKVKELSNKEKKEFLDLLRKDITTGVTEKVKEGKEFLTGLTEEIIEKVEKSRSLTLKEEIAVGDQLVKFLREGKDPQTVTRKTATLLKNRLQSMATAARESKQFTKAEIKQFQDMATGFINSFNTTQLTKANNTFLNNVIKNIQNEGQFNKALEKIENKLNNIINKEENKKISQKIKDELESARSKNVNGRPAGNYPASYQAALDALYEANKLWSEKKTEQIKEIIRKNMIDIEVGAPDSDYLAQKNTYYQLFLDINNRADLLKEIQILKSEGALKREMKAGNEEDLHDAEVNLLTKTVLGNKELPTNTQGLPRRDTFLQDLGSLYSRLIGNWGTKLKILNWKNKSETDENNPFNKYNVNKEEFNHKSLMADFANDFDSALEKAYYTGGKQKFESPFLEKLNKAHIISKALRRLNEKIKLGNFTDSQGNKTGELEFDRNTLIKIWMELQDRSDGGNREILINGNNFTEEIETAINDNISEEDKIFAQEQFNIYQKFGDAMRAFYIKKYGVDFGDRGLQYSPVKIENFKMKDEDTFDSIMKEHVMRTSIIPKSATTRTSGKEKVISYQSSTTALHDYVTQVIKLLTYGEQLQKINKVFNDNRLKSAIKYVYGKSFYKGIQADIKWLTDNSAEGLVIPIIDKIRSNIVISTIALKPKIGLKQTSSFLLYSMEVPYGKFGKYAVEFWNNPIKNTNELKELSPFFKYRGADVDISLREALSSEEYKNFINKPSFTNLITLNVKYGDKAAVYYGGYIMYQNELEKLQRTHPNKSIKELKEKAAFKAAVFSNDTQQSSDPQQQSEFQRGGTLSRLVTPYTSGQTSQIRKEVDAIAGVVRRAKGDKESIKKAAKTIFAIHLTSVLFQLMTDAPDLKWKNVYRALVFGVLNDFWAIGSIFESVYNIITTGKIIDQKGVIESKLTLIYKAIQKLSADDVSIDDAQEAVLLAARGAAPMAGVPIDYSYSFAKGINKLRLGDRASALKYFSGDSEWVVENNNKLTIMLEESSKEKIEPEEAKNLIVDTVKSGMITEEYGKQIWEKFNERQFEYRMKEKIKEINDLENLKEQNDTYSGLKDIEKGKVESLLNSQFGEYQRELKFKVDTKIISEEQAKKLWSRYKEEHWYPGKGL